MTIKRLEDITLTNARSAQSAEVKQELKFILRLVLLLLGIIGLIVFWTIITGGTF